MNFDKKLSIVLLLSEEVISKLIFALTLFLCRRFSAFSISNGLNYFHSVLLIAFVAIKSPLQMIEIFFIVMSVNDYICMEMHQKCYFRLKINVSSLSIALFN